MTNATIRVGIFGGSGYVGLELMRLLLNHPQATLVTVTSREQQGKAIAEVHRSLQGLTSLHFSGPDSAFNDVDVLFLAVPHAQSAPVVGKLFERTRSPQGHPRRIIDLGADFRLPASHFSKFYGHEHPFPELIEQAVYGVPELGHARIQAATLVANPGCFANCVLLALTPLAQHLGAHQCSSLVAHVSAITGSSGSGASATQKTHHPERNESLSAYEVLTHRHIPEIEAGLQIASTRSIAPQVKLVPLSGPFSRGIFATSFVTLPDPSIDVRPWYEEFAKCNPFIRLRSGSPRLVDVRGSNFCDLSVHQQGAEVVVVSTLDNLVKGAAGNAIQNMNIMCGFPETMGLRNAALVP